MSSIISFFRYLVFRERSFYPVNEAEKEKTYDHTIRRNELDRATDVRRTTGDQEK